MPVTALTGRKPIRTLSIRTLLVAATREFDRGNWERGLLLLGLIVLVRSGAVIDAVHGDRPTSG
ncbi:hypothetical protein NDI89_16735 [Natrinema sp. S1CR25-10]|uniref:Uncharacterized protein n=1 Tax=Natrinema salsiterrestre TaxID=2950540 RepID=A0A9Q4L437_9EURY|nr:hypothetical protein [Natrinema salsiterrestre]